MKLLGILVALFAAAPVIVGAMTGDRVLYVFAGFALAAAATTFLSTGISRFLRILIGYFSVEVIVFGALVCLIDLGFWPKALDAVRMKASLAITVALFSIVCWVISFIPVVRRVLVITDRYFEARSPFDMPLGFGRRIKLEERAFAAVVMWIILLLNQLQVFFNVSMSFATQAMYNALQSYDAPAFWQALLVKLPLFLTPYIVSLVFEFLLASMLTIRWRNHLTQDYMSRWLDGQNHYRMMLAGIGTDNPDQRISEDITRFVDGGEFGGAGRLGLYNFSINLIATLSALVSYAIILWSLSANLTLPGTHFSFPGLLLWCAIIYSIIGTALTHLIGRPLASLAFARQHYEANFRFGLARLREYSEQIALLRGEPTEKTILTDRFSSIIRNFYAIVFVRAYLRAFTSFFSVISYFIPYIVMGPFYFAKKVTLGDMTLGRSAFGSVSGALTFFVDYYTSLADFKSVLDRLTTFDSALGAAAPQVTLGHAGSETAKDYVMADVTVDLPNKTPLIGPFDLRFDPKRNILLSGPSGSGKSTFFRAISGVWPYTQGRVELPEDATVMVLPQKPYLPSGTLATAVAYPSPASTYPIEEVTQALRDVGLGHLVDHLEFDDNWTQRLSGGEQQRLAIARAILKRPQWLLLDEATSAMDPQLEASIYALIAKALPETTVVSIAHRETLADHHQRRFSMQVGADGRYVPTEELVAAE